MSAGRTGRDIALQLVLRSLNLGLGVVTVVVLVRALGDEGFGQWATIFAVLGLAGSFGVQGLSTVAVERAAAEPERSPDWVGALVTLRVALSVPLVLVSLAVCLVLADDSAMRVAAVIVHTILLTSALGVARIVFQLQVRNARVSAVELGSGGAWTAAAVVVAGLGGDLVPIAIAFAVVTNLTNLLLYAMSRRAQPVRMRGSRPLWGPLVRLGLPVALASVLALGYGRIDQVLVFELAGAEDAGLYGAVYRIYERLHYLPATLMATLFPIFVAARAQGTERVNGLLQQAIDYLVLVSLPALTVALAGPDEIVRLLFGEEFADAAAALPVLMATFVLISLGHLGGYLVITYGLQRRFVLVALVALVLNVGANLVLVPEYGFIAAAWVTLGTEGFVLTLSLWMVCRRMRVVPTGRRLGRIVAAAAAVGVLAWALRQTGAPLPVWVGVPAVAYGPLLVALGAVELDDVRALLRRTYTPAA